MNRPRKTSGLWRKLLVPVCALLALAAVLTADHWNLLPRKVYTGKDFGIKTIYSTVDFNQNGIDDYTDLLAGARQDAANHPAYDGRYVPGGFPPEDIGVCTDVIWRAFRRAGYDLRAMVNADVLARGADYPTVSEPDPDIDFRRVRNLRVFFDRYAAVLTTDPQDIAAWQPGDIVIFGNDQHIAMVSDRRNPNGVCYFIHNGGQPNREEDYLRRTPLPLVAHYRFDAARVPPALLIPWKG